MKTPMNVVPHALGVIATGKPWKDKTAHFPVETLVNAILSIPGMERKPLTDGRYGIVGFDTNGWQWDWWQHFIYDGQTYILCGSGFYGGHEFALDTD